MIVLGAGGFAQELIDILVVDYKYTKETLFFFDEIDNTKKSFYGFKILHSIKEAEHIFKNISNEFCLGVGTPKARYDLFNKFEQVGGKPKSIFSSNSIIGLFDVKIGDGSCIMSNATISNGVIIGEGTLINADVLAGHDVTIGNFSDISPGVKLTGFCQIGNYVSVGTEVVVLPKVKIGDNSFIAAGSIVANDIPENSMVVGIVPSRVVKKLPEFEI